MAEILNRGGYPEMYEHHEEKDNRCKCEEKHCSCKCEEHCMCDCDRDRKKECADLAIVKKGEKVCECCEEFILYTLYITNYGPNKAREVVVEDKLSCDLECAKYSKDNGRTWCEWKGSLFLGDMFACCSAKILIRAKIKNKCVHEICNKAVIFSETFDPNLENNVSIFKINLKPREKSNGEFIVREIHGSCNFKNELSTCKSCFDKCDRKCEDDKKHDFCDKKFDRCDKFDKCEKFDNCDKKFDDCDRKFERCEKKFDDCDKKFDRCEKKFDECDKKFDDCDKKRNNCNCCRCCLKRICVCRRICW